MLQLKTKIFLISTRKSIGIDDLLNEIPNILDSDTSTIVDNNYMDFETIQKINNENNSSSFYKRWLSQINKISNLDNSYALPN